MQGSAEARTVRPPAVAGSFYPADADALRRTLQPPLTTATPSAHNEESPRPKALILPHAGHRYCATIASAAINRLHNQHYSMVVILAPSHRVAIRGAAVPAHSHFATPLGTVALNRDAIAQLERHPAIQRNDMVHQSEHAIEVLLPYLQLVLPPFSLLPIAAGEISADILAALLQPLWAQEEILLIISSDLSHFLPYGRACEIDRATCCAIVAGQEVSHQQACGATGINTLQRLRGHRPLQQLAYCNSGDRGAGRDSVVGYASFALA